MKFIKYFDTVQKNYNGGLLNHKKKSKAWTIVWNSRMILRSFVQHLNSTLHSPKK